MGEAVKQKLLDLTEETHSALLDTVVNVDLEIIIHKDSGWRGREMLSHIGAWDREVAKALYEFLNGGEYLILDYDEDRYNDQAAKKQQNMTTAEIIEDWKSARKELIEALEIIPVDSFSGDLLFPWGDERGTIYDLVKYLCDHDIEHKEEIENIMRNLE
jgi:hypothetical protein